MLNAPGFARDLKRGEEDAVDHLLSSAFGGNDEIALVRKLRKKQNHRGRTSLADGRPDRRLLCPVLFGETQRMVGIGPRRHRT